MTEREMSAILTRAYLMYPTLQISREAILAWFDTFKAWTAEEFSQAMSRATVEASSSFFPAPGQVHALLMQAKHERQRIKLERETAARIPLPEPELSEEERAAKRAWARDLVEKAMPGLLRKMDMNGGRK